MIDLNEAINNKDIVKVKELLDRGVNVDLRDEDEATPFYNLSLYLGYVFVMQDLETTNKIIEIMKILVQYGCDINARIYNNWTALIECAERGYIKSIELLIYFGAELNVTDSTGQTALFYACENDHWEIVDLLLKAGAKINIIDKEGETALMKAASEGYNKCVKLLLDNKIDVQIRNNKGLSALDLALVRLQIAEHRKLHSSYPSNEYDRCLETVQLINMQL